MNNWSIYLHSCLQLKTTLFIQSLWPCTTIVTKIIPPTPIPVHFCTCNSIHLNGVSTPSQGKSLCIFIIIQASSDRVPCQYWTLIVYSLEVVSWKMHIYSRVLFFTPTFFCLELSVKRTVEFFLKSFILIFHPIKFFRILLWFYWDILECQFTVTYHPLTMRKDPMTTSCLKNVLTSLVYCSTYHLW